MVSDADTCYQNRDLHLEILVKLQEILKEIKVLDHDLVPSKNRI